VPLHLTKVAFACPDLDALRRRITGRAIGGEVRVATRMRPKRAAELIGGSLFWIVKHRLVAGQQIVRFDDRDDGRIDIVCTAELVAIAPRHCRAHQGWRYLEDDAGLAREDSSGVSLLPAQLYGKLVSLALV
jgi:hypothetical protein